MTIRSVPGRNVALAFDRIGEVRDSKIESIWYLREFAATMSSGGRIGVVC